MRGKEPYQKIPGIQASSRVSGFGPALGGAPGSVTATVEAEPGTRLPCPECGKPCPRHDSRRREWRRPDPRRVPYGDRRRGSPHGVSGARCASGQLPGLERGSAFTALFEAPAIDRLQEASRSAVGRWLGLSWNAGTRA